MRSFYIEKRIDELLKERNFFFYKIFEDTEANFQLKNEIEHEEIKRFVDAHKKISKCYLSNGQIEPLYLTEEERKLLTEGMEQSLKKIQLEIYKSIQLTQQISGKPSENLVNRMKKIEIV